MISNTNPHTHSHSATVSLQLEIGGEVLSVCTVEPEQFVLTKPRSLVQQDAVLVITVDGRVRRRAIQLHPTSDSLRTIPYSRR